MDHSEAQELFSAYIEGDLDADSKRDLETHLRSDPECARALEEFKQVLGTLRGLAQETPRAPAPASFLKRVQAKIRRRTHGGFYAMTPMFRVPWEIILVIVGVMLAGAWMLVQPGLGLYDPGPTPRTTSPTPGNSAAPIRPTPPPGVESARPDPATASGSETRTPGSAAPGSAVPGASTGTGPTGALAPGDDGRGAGLPRVGAGTRAGIAVSTTPGHTTLSTPAGVVDVRVEHAVERSYRLRIEVDDGDVPATRLHLIGLIRLAGDSRLTAADAKGTDPIAFAVPRGRFKAFLEGLTKTYVVHVESTPVAVSTPSKRVSGTVEIR